MLKLTQQEFESVPFQVTVEVLLAAAFCMWGKELLSARSSTIDV
jgi:hypothetical protein